MRGKLTASRRNGQNVRITPADAGTTICGENDLLKAQDHPRGCGENHVSSRSISYDVRITPADAGKT